MNRHALSVLLAAFFATGAIAGEGGVAELPPNMEEAPDEVPDAVNEGVDEAGEAATEEAPGPVGDAPPEDGQKRPAKILKKRAVERPSPDGVAPNPPITLLNKLFPLSLRSPYHPSISTGALAFIWVANFAGLWTVGVPLGFLIPVFVDSPGGEYWTDAAVIVLGHGAMTVLTVLLIPLMYLCPPTIVVVGAVNWARVLWFLPMGIVNSWDYHLKERDGGAVAPPAAPRRKKAAMAMAF